MTERTHTVELDVEAEIAVLEQAALEAEATEAELERQADEVGHDPAQWRSAADLLVSFVDAKVWPNWALKSADNEQLAAATARVLDCYFPGGVQGVDNWHPLWQLVAAVGGIALTRGFDFDRFAFKPLHPPKESDDGASSADGRLEQLPDGDDTERQVKPGFSIGAG